jgi:hypothetical protein
LDYYTCITKPKYNSNLKVSSIEKEIEGFIGVISFLLASLQNLLEFVLVFSIPSSFFQPLINTISHHIVKLKFNTTIEGIQDSFKRMIELLK